MSVSIPARWYMAFWLMAGIIALTPIYVLLFLIWEK